MMMLLRNLGNPRARIGAALLRISLGMAMLYEYAINYSQRHDLWGPDRVAREYPVLEFSPYTWSASAVYFDIVLHVGILVAFLFVMGIGGRATTCVMWAMTWFLQDLNNLIGDGGDNIARIVLLYMIFADVSGRRERSVSLVSGLLHNAAILAVVIQVSMLYLSTGMYKIMGEYWQNGVALYYILRVNSYSWTGLGELLYANEYIVVLLTYATVLFEIAFPFALFNRWTRRSILAAGVLFHLGIAVSMGLVAFSWMMLSLYFVFVSDREYERVKSLLSVDARESVVLYDDACGLCGRFVGFVRQADGAERLRYLPLQGNGAKHLLASRGINAERLDTIYVVESGGRVLSRSSAIILIMRCLGWPWCLAAAASAFPERLRDAAYDLFAQNRYLGNACSMSSRYEGEGEKKPCARC